MPGSAKVPMGSTKSAGAAVSTTAKGGGSATSSNPFAANLTRTSPATVVWLHENFEAADGVSLGRSTLYAHYEHHCANVLIEKVNAASFGKLIRSVFPNLKTRRLGTRGNSKYHYYGIAAKAGSKLTFEADQVGGPHHRYQRGSEVAPAPKAKGKAKATAADEEGEAEMSAIDAGLAEYINVEESLPDFPPMSSTPDLEATDDFSKPYHAHCKDVLKALCEANFFGKHGVQEKWNQFWGQIAPHFRGMLSSEAGISHFDRCNAVFFDTLHNALVTDVLCGMPDDLTKEIRHFAKSMARWLKEAMEGYSEELVECQMVRVRTFARTLRRYTSVNHLGQAAQDVFKDSIKTQLMLQDLTRIDLKAVTVQAQAVCNCSADTVERLEREFKQGLNVPYSLEQWLIWMQRVLKDAVADSENPEKEARQFLLSWTFYSSVIIRDLTLRSAKSFGSFHLMRLLCDEFIMFLVEQLVAKGVEILDMVPAACARARPIEIGALDSQTTEVCSVGNPDDAKLDVL